MRKIDRGYAVIYVDDDNELISLDPNKGHDYTTNDIQNAYYKIPGAIQWNYYTIIPKDDSNSHILTEEKIKEIEKNECYSRKYVIDRYEIDKFIKEYFPENLNIDSKVILVTGDSYINSRCKLSKSVKHSYCEFVSSFNRDYNSLTTLRMMDELRARLLTNTWQYDEKIDKTLIVYFYTHIEDEINLFQKKFEFLGDNFIYDMKKVKADTSEID